MKKRIKACLGTVAVMLTGLATTSVAPFHLQYDGSNGSLTLISDGTIINYVITGPQDAFLEDAPVSASVHQRFLFGTGASTDGNQVFSATPPTNPDGDMDIDDVDLATSFANFTGPVGVSGGKTLQDGDTDGDGDVDDADLANLFSSFTGPADPVSILSETNPYAPAPAGNYNLGAVLPPGLTDAQFRAWITSAKAVSGLGQPKTDMELSSVNVAETGLLVEESFDYVLGSLAGNEGGTGFAGAWTATRQNPAVSPPDKDWGILSSAGGHARGDAWSGMIRPLGTTLFDAGLMANGATLWFSVVMDLEGQNVANADLSLSLGTSGFLPSDFADRENLVDGEGIGVTHSLGRIQGVYWQNNDGDPVAERTENDSATLIDGTGGNGTRALVVGKIEWGVLDGDSETLTLYTPGLDLTQGSPAMASWTIPALDQSAFDTLALQFKDQAQFDEIRFGGSFAEVTPSDVLLSPDTLVIGGALNVDQFEVGTAGLELDANKWPPAETPADLVNGVIGGAGDKYLNFAKENTGVLVTPGAPGGRSIVTGMLLWVANDAPERDPASYELYGTNVAISGGGPFPLSDFTLISSGALSLPDDRNTTGVSDFYEYVPISNTDHYESYLVLFPTVKDPGLANSMQLSELQLAGTFAISLPDALDTTGLDWSGSATPGWFGQASITHDGEDSAQSGDISNLQATTMETTVTGEGLLSFWWKVSSESGFDFLRFYIDGVEQAAAPAISGDVDWQQVQVAVPPGGDHTLSWTYSKDISISNGADAGWVDEVVFTPLSGYDLWAALNVPEGADATFEGVSSLTGVPNGIAYVFGPSPVETVLAPGEGTGRITAPPSTPPDVDVYLELSAPNVGIPLQEWTTIISWENGLPPVFLFPGFTTISEGFVTDVGNLYPFFYRYRFVKR